MYRPRINPKATLLECITVHDIYNQIRGHASLGEALARTSHSGYDADYKLASILCVVKM